MANRATIQEEVVRTDLDFVPVDTSSTQEQRRETALTLVDELQGRLHSARNLTNADRLRIFDSLSGLEGAVAADDKDGMMEEMATARALLRRLPLPHPGGYPPNVETGTFEEQDFRDTAQMYEVNLSGQIDELRQSGLRLVVMNYAEEIIRRLHNESGRQPLNRTAINELIQEAEGISRQIEEIITANR
ncbi:MAG: hypothetical protein ABII71_02125 [Candidatus Micrarchaeota archaeon]